MSVTLISPLPVFAFSRDQLKVQFECTGTMESEGAYAVNELALLLMPIASGNTMVFKYGSTTITMVSANEPDDSGLQFSSTTSNVADILEALKSNQTLSRDFEISLAGTLIELTARKKALGYDITEHYIGYSFVQNATPGSVAKERANYGVFLRLYLENLDHTGFEICYEGTLPVAFGTGGIAELNIGDKLHDRISADIRNNLPDIPTDGPLICKKSCRKYYFEYAESYGTPVTARKLHKSAIVTVLHGGFSTLGQASTSLTAILGDFGRGKRFLKQGGKINSTRSNQLQFLYYVNSAAALLAQLQCRLRFTDGTRSLVTLYNTDLLAATKYGFEVSCAKVFNQAHHAGKTLLAYEIFLADMNGYQFTETQTYILDYRPLQFVRYFTNWSSWGTMDSRMFYGKGSLEISIEQSEADKVNPNPQDITQGTSLVYDIRLKSRFAVTTGFMESREQLITNRDFYSSPLKYRISNSQWLPLKVTSKTIEELQDGNSLYAQKFEYEYLFEDQAYTEGDVQEPGISFPIAKPGFSDQFLTDNEKNFLITTLNEFITI